MEGSADNLMNTDVACEDHVPIIGVLGAKTPYIVQLARPTSFFGKAADGAIVTGEISAVFVFAFAHLCVLINEFLVFHNDYAGCVYLHFG